MAEFDFSANTGIGFRYFFERALGRPFVSTPRWENPFFESRLVLNIGLSGQDVIQSAHRGRTTLEDVGHESDGNHRENELAQKSVERKEGTHRNTLVRDLNSAYPKKDYDREADKRREGWKEQAPGSDELDVVANVVPIRAVEGCNFGFLLSIRADHSHAG